MQFEVKRWCRWLCNLFIFSAFNFTVLSTSSKLMRLPKTCTPALIQFAINRSELCNKVINFKQRQMDKYLPKLGRHYSFAKLKLRKQLAEFLPRFVRNKLQLTFRKFLSIRMHFYTWLCLKLARPGQKSNSVPQNRKVTFRLLTDWLNSVIIRQSKTHTKLSWTTTFGVENFRLTKPGPRNGPQKEQVLPI